MGESDEPRNGFDYWLSFKGQGTYWPDGHGTSRKVPQINYEGFNINGQRVSQIGYITDELTDYAINWLQSKNNNKPFMLYLSHKAVHSDFVAADRHIGFYKNDTIPQLYSLINTDYNFPMWLQNQKNSRHGVDYAYNLEDFDLNRYYQRYAETLLTVDENVGRIIDYLQNNDLLDKTMIIYMGDNGFQFGEHGLIDKRTAYNASIRIPLLIRYPESFQPGMVIKEMVANIDIAPTILNFAGIDVPDNMDGTSFLPLLKGEKINWREKLLYEYYWESNYPYTPTTFALLTDNYKYIHYYGIWDIDELYDIQNDPDELKNLIYDSAHQNIAVKMKNELTEILMKTGGNKIPLGEERGETFPWRKKEATEQAPFPDYFFQ
jgi:N-acetylglucosamine-6-sulfatase